MITNKVPNISLNPPSFQLLEILVIHEFLLRPSQRCCVVERSTLWTDKDPYFFCQILCLKKQMLRKWCGHQHFTSASTTNFVAFMLRIVSRLLTKSSEICQRPSNCCLVYNELQSSCSVLSCSLCSAIEKHTHALHLNAWFNIPLDTLQVISETILQPTVS